MMQPDTVRLECGWAFTSNHPRFEGEPVASARVSLAFEDDDDARIEAHLDMLDGNSIHAWDLDGFDEATREAIATALSTRAARLGFDVELD